MENNLKKGRPERGVAERYRTLLWSHAVEQAAGLNLKSLEEILGADGKWQNLWQRYERGLVSPTARRVDRIGKILPGTEQYFFSPLWELVENREYRRSELRAVMCRLSAPFKSAFIGDDKSAEGIFWRQNFSTYDTLEVAQKFSSDQKFGLDAVTTILIVIREAQLIQNAHLYLSACKAWASLEENCASHFVLSRLSQRFLDFVIEPLRYMVFADAEIDAIWQQHIIFYREKHGFRQDNFEIIHALRTLQI